MGMFGSRGGIGLDIKPKTPSILDRYPLPWVPGLQHETLCEICCAADEAKQPIGTYHTIWNVGPDVHGGVIIIAYAMSLLHNVPPDKWVEEHIEEALQTIHPFPLPWTALYEPENNAVRFKTATGSVVGWIEGGYQEGSFTAKGLADTILPALNALPYKEYKPPSNPYECPACQKEGKVNLLKDLYPDPNSGIYLPPRVRDLYGCYECDEGHRYGQIISGLGKISWKPISAIKEIK